MYTTTSVVEHPEHHSAIGKSPSTVVFKSLKDNSVGVYSNAC
jgi:hypothetical protein